jgi:hypothetical protein
MEKILNKKILIWIDDSSYFQYCIASLVQEQVNCKVYAVADVNENSKKFLQNQTFVKFEKIWFLRDHVYLQNFKPNTDYLEKFEETYKINLWVVAHSERLFFKYNAYHKFSRDEILSIIEKECHLYEEVLKEFKPDFLFIKYTDLHQNHLLLELAKSLKIHILTLAPTKLGNSCHISQEQEKIDQTNDLTEISEKDISEKLQNYLKFNDPYIKDMQKKISEKITNKKRISLLNQLFPKTNTLEYKNYYGNFGKTVPKIIIIQLQSMLKNYFRKQFLNKNAIKNTSYEKIIFFPLHLEPDRATLINSPFYTDQLDIIFNIAKSLPTRYKLFVKEHGSQSLLMWKKTSFYKKILSIPNVELVHPSMNPKKMLEQCKLVITIAGTTGLEALFYNKPVIIMTDATYSSMPGVFRINHITELPEVIRTALSTKIDDSGAKEMIRLIENEAIRIDYTELQESVMHILGSQGISDLIIPTISKFKKIFYKHENELKILASKHIEKMNFHDENKIIIGKKKDLMHFK